MTRHTGAQNPVSRCQGTRPCQGFIGAGALAVAVPRTAAWCSCCRRIPDSDPDSQHRLVTAAKLTLSLTPGSCAAREPTSTLGSWQQVLLRREVTRLPCLSYTVTHPPSAALSSPHPTPPVPQNHTPRSVCAGCGSGQPDAVAEGQQPRAQRQASDKGLIRVRMPTATAMTAIAQPPHRTACSGPDVTCFCADALTRRRRVTA